jgi:hypothetical protein
MAAAPVNTGPPRSTLTLVKGEDVDVVFVYKTLLVDGQGDPILDGNGAKQFVEADYPMGMTVSLAIDPSIVGQAAVTLSRARVVIDHTLVDKVRAGALWRLVLTDSDGIDRVPINGVIARSDGQG